MSQDNQSMMSHKERSDKFAEEVILSLRQGSEESTQWWQKNEAKIVYKNASEYIRKYGGKYPFEYSKTEIFTYLGAILLILILIIRPS